MSTPPPGFVRRHFLVMGHYRRDDGIKSLVDFTIQCDLPEARPLISKERCLANIYKKALDDPHGFIPGTARVRCLTPLASDNEVKAWHEETGLLSDMGLDKTPDDLLDEADD